MCNPGSLRCLRKCRTMARKHDLRKSRTGTVINVTAKKQESDVIQALLRVEQHVTVKFGRRISLEHVKRWYLKDIVSQLMAQYPEVDFHHHSDRTFIQPDGGFLTIQAQPDDPFMYPILISEVKNQGTNVLREREGLPRQAMGNAIERLGKNVIGLRTALMREDIFPFVCFGYGCDFAEQSSILDRVATIAMFGQLNRTYLFHQGEGKFNRGSFYFREERWSVEEMTDVMKDIADRSVFYYFAKYGEGHFPERQQ